MKIKITEWQQLFQNCVSNPSLPISLPTVALANPPYCQINLAFDSELARFEMAYKWIKHGDGSYVITSKLKNQVEQELGNYRLLYTRTLAAATSTKRRLSSNY